MIRPPNRFTAWVQRYEFTPAEVVWLFNRKLRGTRRVHARLVRRWLRESTADWALEMFPRLSIPSRFERAVRAATRRRAK